MLDLININHRLPFLSHNYTQLHFSNDMYSVQDSEAITHTPYSARCPLKDIQWKGYRMVPFNLVSASSCSHDSDSVGIFVNPWG